MRIRVRDAYPFSETLGTLFSNGYAQHTDREPIYNHIREEMGLGVGGWNLNAPRGLILCVYAHANALLIHPYGPKDG